MITVKWGNNLLYGNEPNRVLGPKEQKIYDDYQLYCWQFDILPASEERWRMESQRIPNV